VSWISWLASAWLTPRGTRPGPLPAARAGRRRGCRCRSALAAGARSDREHRHVGQRQPGACGLASEGVRPGARRLRVDAARALDGGREDGDLGTSAEVACHRLGDAELNGQRQHAVRYREPAGVRRAGRQHGAQQELPGLHDRVGHQGADVRGDRGKRVGRHRRRWQPLGAEQPPGPRIRRGGARGDGLAGDQHGDRVLPREGTRVRVVDVGEHPAGAKHGKQHGKRDG
jgi:hypothetical protein